MVESRFSYLVRRFYYNLVAIHYYNNILVKSHQSTTILT